MGLRMGDKDKDKPKYKPIDPDKAQKELDKIPQGVFALAEPVIMNPKGLCLAMLLDGFPVKKVVEYIEEEILRRKTWPRFACPRCKGKIILRAVPYKKDKKLNKYGYRSCLECIECAWERYSFWTTYQVKEALQNAKYRL